MTDSGVSSPIPFEDLSPAVQRSVGPKAPAPLKLMTARGMAPMPPRDLVTAQVMLAFDGDPKVSEAAAKSGAASDITRSTSGFAQIGFGSGWPPPKSGDGTAFLTASAPAPSRFTRISVA